MRPDTTLSRPACALIALVALTLAAGHFWGPWAGLLAFGLVLLLAAAGYIWLPRPVTRAEREEMRRPPYA